jgi:galactokinase
MNLNINDVNRRLNDAHSLPSGWRILRKTGLRLVDYFNAQYPGNRARDVSFGFVPGRIEALGRHTDYAGGRSLVCAIERGFLFVAAPNRDAAVRLGEDSSEFPYVEFGLSSSAAPKIGHWANYPFTMARRLARNFGSEGPLKGVDIAFASTLPVGSGMSGSSALMMMTFVAIASLNNLQSTRPFLENILDPIDLAVYLACAENGQGFRGLKGDRGVGTFGGSEDHAAILTGKPGILSLYGFCPASLQDEAPWPRGWRMVVAFSGVRAEKTREALEKYNLVSRRAREAVLRYNRAFDARFTTLRQVADDAADRKGPTWLDALDSPPSVQVPGLADRVRQFILEDRRLIPTAMDALHNRDLRGFGKVLTASHRASKKYLWNIVPEIDFLQRAAVRLGAAGASGFGAGFGGSIYAVVPAARAKSFMSQWREQYIARYPAHAGEASFFLTSAGPGIQIWDTDGPVRFVDKLFPT